MTVAPVQNQQCFQAAWPKALDPALKNTLVKVAQVILKIVLFPFVFIRNHLRNVVYRIIVPGYIAIHQLQEEVKSYWDVTKVVLRLIFNPNSYTADLTEEGNSLLRKFSGESIKIKTPDGAVLDGAFFPGKKPKKAIIYATGNAHQWELLESKLEMLKPLGTSILILNPRGVGKSTGDRSEEGYSLDYYTAFEYLIQKHNLDPESILSIGFSMGDAMTALGAALIQEKYPDKKISAINMCSFSSLQLEIQKVLGKWGALAKFGAKLIGVDMNIKEAWDKLKGQKCVFYNPTDEVIPKAASLAEAIKKDPKKRPCHLIEMLPIPDHNRPLIKEEIHFLNQEIRKTL